MTKIGRIIRRLIGEPPPHPRTVLDQIDPAASVLEVGPFFRPAVRGPNVRYFDVLTHNELVTRATAIGFDPTYVPEFIDFVSPVGDMSVIEGTYDFIVSSHCIEHQPDLVAHLEHIAGLLKPQGAYLAIIPDKRYCFDHFLPESSLSDIVAAHIERRRVHPADKIIEHLAGTTHNDPVRHWAGDHKEAGWQQYDAARVSHACNVIAEASGGYVDVHSWQFTPRSFVTTLDGLRQLGLTRLSATKLLETPRNALEFSAVIQWDKGPIS